MIKKGGVPFLTVNITHNDSSFYSSVTCHSLHMYQRIYCEISPSQKTKKEWEGYLLEFEKKSQLSTWSIPSRFFRGTVWGWKAGSRDAATSTNRGVDLRSRPWWPTRRWRQHSPPLHARLDLTLTAGSLSFSSTAPVQKQSRIWPVLSWFWDSCVLPPKQLR
jgi:hypothetical protein